MAYWFQQVAANPIGASVCVILLAAAAALLLYLALIVRAWFKKQLELASFMIPHHIGASSPGRSVSPGIYVIDLRYAVIVGYAAKDIKDADQVCKSGWFRKGLQGLIIDDVPVWNGKTKIAAREADASERIRFMNAMQIYNGILLGRTDASDPLQFVLVDRNNRRVVKIGYT
jgi:hypothetical protein